MLNIINAKWLISNLENNNLVIIDCRFSLTDREYSSKSYKEAHIKGAIHIDIEKEIFAPSREKGLHFIDNLPYIKELLESKGIDSDSMVVVYDDGYLVESSMIVWILRYLGHKASYILDGGIEAFKASGGEITSESTIPVRGVLNVDLKEFMKIDMESVREGLYRDDTVIVDCREESKYNELIDDKYSEHIPEAKNYYWRNVIDEFGPIPCMKTPKELKFYFNQLKRYNNVIVYCDTGLEACIMAIALDEAGIDTQLYIRGLNDWISHAENKTLMGMLMEV